jgi:ABC-type cobalamin/Fe3+-siderophores transport system ATPase subunit/uncharacterized protein (DUF2164 family)
MGSVQGSRWNKWDLHVHSPASFDEDYSLGRSVDTEEEYEEAIWDKYLDELEGIGDISCVAITDYFSVEGYERVREAVEQDGRLQNLDIVLPNIELRVDHFVTSRSGGNVSQAVEMHVLFSDELDPIRIRENFVNQLEAKRPDGSTMPPTRENLVRLGQNSDFDTYDDYDDPYIAGCNRITVDVDTIYEALDNDIFDGKYLTILVEDGWEKISWEGRAGTLRGSLLGRANAVFISNSDTRDWLLGQTEMMSADEFRQAFDSLKPALRGSDSDEFEDFCVPDKKRYCWIKADTTFEGLKQIKYEPADRVHIGEHSPQRRVSIHTPRKVEIREGQINDRLTVADTTLPLNPNLVTVIGGKGAGKTALLDLIANCYQNRHISNEDEEIDVNSFIQRIQDEKPDVSTELKFHGEDIDNFEKPVLDDECISHSNIEYLPQGKISEYCRDEDRMHEQVLELIQQSVRTTDSELMERFEKKRSGIDKIEKKLEELTNRIHEFDPGTIGERINESESELSAAQGKLEDKEREIEEFKEEHGDELQDESSTELQSQLDFYDENLQNIKEIKLVLSEQIERLEKIEEFNRGLEKLKSLSEETEIEVDVDVTQFIVEEVKLNLHDYKQSIDDERSRIERERESVQSQLNELEDIDEDLSQLLSEKREQKKIVKEKENELQLLEDNRQKLQELRTERRDEFIDYVDAYHDLKSLYSLVISEFSADQSAILDEVKFDAYLEVTNDLQSQLYDLLDGRSVNIAEIQPIIQSATDAIEDSEQSEHYAESYLDEALSFKDQLLEKASTAEFERRVFTGNFKLSEQILLEGTRMEDLSLGQKGTVLLKILLAQEGKPLIIDQPEENLDNRFVYKTLKDAFKEAKKKRQVIIATHNANLVVNTDAEQVVVAQYEENEISFKSGPLEDEKIRKEVTTVLEGGKEAFVRREEKYGLA